MSQSQYGVVLLAAGRGSRLGSLTTQTHKSLLPIAGRPAIQYILDEVISRDIEDVVVVTGDKREAVETFIQSQFPGRVTVAFNEHYASDTNILSTEIGVSALRRPHKGYLIVETDLIVEPNGWSCIFDVEDGGESFWVTRGTYSRQVTGGALLADGTGKVVGLVYSPEYDPLYEGWQKLLGVLYVGRDLVTTDRQLRQSAIGRSIAQYYMTPWVEHLPLLPCRAKMLGNLYAASYNDVESYRAADSAFTTVLDSLR